MPALDKKLPVPTFRYGVPLKRSAVGLQHLIQLLTLQNVMTIMRPFWLGAILTVLELPGLRHSPDGAFSALGVEMIP